MPRRKASERVEAVAEEVLELQEERGEVEEVENTNWDRIMRNIKELLMDIPLFDGENGMGVDEFVEECLQAMEDTDKGTELPDSRKIRVVASRLSGRAKRWYLNWRKDFKGSSYEKFCSDLEKTFPLDVRVERWIREFSARKQKIGEPIAQYADDLMDLGSRAGHKDVIIMTHFLGGLLPMYKKALTHLEPKCMEDAVRQAIKLETSLKEIKEEDEELPRINRISTQRRQGNIRRKGLKCFKCGKEGHIAKNCGQYTKEKQVRTCYNCGKQGHMKKDCFLLKEGRQINSVSDNSHGLMTIQIKINGQVAQALVDTGAELSLIDSGWCHKEGIMVDDRKNTKFSQAIQGNNITSKGQAKVDLIINQTQVQANVDVVEGLNYPFYLGLDLLTALEAKIDLRTHMLNIGCMSISLRGVNNIKLEDWTIEEGKQKVDELVVKYSDIFGDFNVANVSPAKISISPNAVPIRSPPYRLSKQEEVWLEGKIKEMLKDELIEISTSEWTSPVVLPRKKDGNFRLCVDYKRINKLIEGDGYPLPRIDDILEELGGNKYFSLCDQQSGFWQIPIEENSRKYTAFTTKFGQYQWKVLPMV
jgi:hypothetical protein